VIVLFLNLISGVNFLLFWSIVSHICRSVASTGKSSQPPFQQLFLPAPPVSNTSSTPSAKVDPSIDLLSGDDYNKPAAENPLALVPVSEPVSLSASDQNVLALADMFPRNNSSNNNSLAVPAVSDSVFSAPQAHPLGSQLQLLPQQQTQPALYSNGGIPNSVSPSYEQATYAQGAQMNHANPSWNGQPPQALDYSKFSLLFCS